MTPEQFEIHCSNIKSKRKEAVLKVKREYEEKHIQLSIAYAESQNTVDVGDIVKSDTGRLLQVTHWGVLPVGPGRPFPEMMYHGVQLNKKMTPKKKQRITRFTQGRVVEIIRAKVK